MKMVLKYLCPCCKQESRAYPTIKKVFVDGVNTEKDEIYITDIECEKCGKISTVQVDNEFTYNLLERQKKISIKMGTTKFRYGVKARRIKKINQQLERVSNKLLKERDVLSKIYNNIDYYNENNEKIGTIFFKEVHTQLISARIVNEE